MAITPRGMEPANIKKRLDTLFPKLNEAYPDKVIRSLAKDHKKWAETVTELYRTLGYPDSESFLKAYGYTVERAIPTGRPSHDYMAVIEELKKRYPNGATFKKIGELQEANPDLAGNFKTLANKSKELFGMSLADYFKSIGLLDGSDHKKQLDELLAELKRRYAEGTVLPATLAELKENNADLMVYRLSYIKEIYDVNPQEYLIEIGLLRDEQKEDEAFIHKWVELLLQRYDATDKKPETLNALKAQNPDCPFNDIAAKIQKTGLTQKDFFINAGLIVEKKYYTVDEEILLKEFGPDYLSEDAQYQRMCKFVQALTLNGNKKSSSQSVIFAAEAKLISQYRAAYHVEQKRSTITMAVHIDTLLRKKGLSEISVNDTIEFHHDTVNGSLALYVFTEQGKRIGCLSYHFSIINPLLACKDAYVVNGRIAYLKRPDHQNDYKEIIATFDLVFNQKAFSVLQCDGKELFEEKEIPFQLEECPDFAPPKAIAVSDDDDAWGNAIAKGLEKDVDAAIDHLDERGLQRPTKMPTDIPGIYQFQTGYPLEIIEEFPALKVLAFYIDYIDYSVSEVYSPSGCSQITASKVIGLFDPKADPSWYVECFPGKAFLKTFRWTQTSYIEKVTYTVPAREQWDDKYYFTFLENKLLKVILTTSAKADLENLQRTERTLQGEAERKHQEEAAAYKRALEMAHKAAEEEKQRREAAELERKCQEAADAERKRIEEEQRKRIEAEELKLKQAEEQKRREEEERKRKEAEEAERIRQKEARRLAEEKYAADLKAWERTCEDVKKQREQAVVERTAAERASLESAAQQTYESAIRAATQRKADAQQSKSDAEMRLSKLGIFKFAEKKSLKETIENAEREIYTANIALSTAKQALERAMAAVPAQLSANEPEIITGVEQDYPLPAKPEK